MVARYGKFQFGFYLAQTTKSRGDAFRSSIFSQITAMQDHIAWREAKVLIGYTIPIFATHVLELSLSVASVFSLGHLGTVASLGVYGYDQADLDTQWSAQALLGARYTF